MKIWQLGKKSLLINSLALVAKVGSVFLGINLEAYAKAVNPLLIGIIQVVEHPALDQTREGLIDELKAFNKIKGQKSVIEWSWESSQGNASMGVQIAQKYAGKKAAVIVALGTVPAQATMRVQRNYSFKLVFSSVSDPKSAKLCQEDGTNFENVTGVSNYVDLEKQIEFMKKILPNLKKIGVIYNPGEVNSAYLTEQLESLGHKYELSVVPMTATKTSEVPGAAKALIGKVDAIFINNDNTALSAFDSIIKACHPFKVPVFSSDVDLVKNGALAGMGANQYELGRQTGRMILKLIKTQTTNVPIEGAEKVEIHINQKVACLYNIHIDQAILAQADKLINQ